jgi:hypothetical protein
MKIVINRCYGGFGLSEVALTRYKNESGRDVPYYGIPRDDPILVSIVEELGEDAWGQFAKLKVVDIPDDVEWHIGEYDGIEWVAENHRTWG